MQQQVVAVAGVDELAIITGQRLEPLVSRLDEDIRFVSGAAKDALDAQDFMADRIAVSERGQHLVDADHAVSRRGSCFGIRDSRIPDPESRIPDPESRVPAWRPSTAGPTGSRCSTSSAGGTFWRRRANHPGSASAGRVGGSFFSRSNMSRYFRSITGQSYCSR